MNEIILNGNAIQAKNISFQSKKNRKKYPNNTSNTMERSPENDKFEGRKKKPGLWIGLGTVALLAVATAVEVFKFKGKYFDNLVSFVKKKLGKNAELPGSGNHPAPVDKKPPVDVSNNMRVVEPTEIKAPDGRKLQIEAPKSKPAKVEDVKTPKSEPAKIEAPKNSKSISSENEANIRNTIKDIDYSQYPKNYTENGFEVEERIIKCPDGDFIRIDMKKGDITKNIISYDCSTAKLVENLYRKGKQEKTIGYQIDGITKSYEDFYENGVLMRTIRYMKDGKTKNFESIHTRDNGHKIKHIYYKEDGKTIHSENLYEWVGGKLVQIK